MQKAHSGEKAVELFRAGPDAVDLVVLDINLKPDMDGIETARRILSMRDVPVIFLSSHTEKEIVKKTEEVSSYGYVVKNSGVYVLEAAIKRAFALREKEEELKRSETRFRTYFDLPHVGLSITSPGKYWLEVNDKLCSMLGYSREELMTKTWAELTYAEDLELDSDRAVLFGIIVNELVTNAVKHAYPYTVEGDVAISMWEDAGNFHLRVADYGQGLPADDPGDRSGGGLGLQLVRTLAVQLEGDFTLDKEGGTAVTIRVAMEELSN